ncbi:MAG TPA: DUF1345 domain-containing protein [Tahibacter sp.]|nr:DUF1345 domain-containing protein [Tahibacter sp.]
MRNPLSHLFARPRLTSALIVGIAAGFLLPGHYPWVTRALAGWNCGVWLYLVLIAATLLRSDHERSRRIALAHAEGAATVLVVVIASAMASLVGIVVELSAAKVPGAAHALSHVGLALSTVVGGWLLLPTLFTLTYASVYYVTEHKAGLIFPDTDPAFRPNYSDFLYFSITIAVASQTADVCVSSPHMRRLVLLQSVLSFVFNTAILAFTINIAASMF